MARKRNSGRHFDQPPFKFYYKLVLLLMLVVGLPLTLFVTQTKQTTLTSANNMFPTGGILGPGPSMAEGSMGKSQSCVNGKCYSCASETGCSIECKNDSCTCEPGPCKESPQVSGRPSFAPKPSKRMEQNREQIRASGKSISCVNGKCYSCDGSTASCRVLCENETCTCEPGPCKEVASEISGVPLPGSGSADIPQMPLSNEDQKNFIQNIIDAISEFFKNLFK